ncbi:sugar phosphate isomerase/epimerase family protein, partial [Singulisphaera rosea]
WPLPVDWKGDAGRFARDLERLPRYAEAAAILGLFRTGTWVLPETLGRSGAGEDPETVLEETASWHRERLAAMANVLERHGSRLGLEVIGVESFRTGNGLPFISRLGDIEARLGAIRSLGPNVGILLDVHHLYAAGESIEAGLTWGVDRLVWVHVADLPASASSDRHAMRDDVRGLPGEHGAIDCRGFLERLAVEGYDGPVTAEPLAACRSLSGLDPKAKVHTVSASLRSVWPIEGVV